MDDREAVEARLLETIVARAPRRLEADRPRRNAVLNDVEEMAAGLQRIERPTDEIDRAAAALGDPSTKTAPRPSRRSSTPTAPLLKA